LPVHHNLAAAQPPTSLIRFYFNRYFTANTVSFVLHNSPYIFDPPEAAPLGDTCRLDTEEVIGSPWKIDCETVME
jgi:hypothetical protein